MKRLEEIEARLSDATPRPWVVKRDRGLYEIKAQCGPRMLTHGSFPGEENAHLIANAPADLRYLLDFAKAAREALERHVSECFYGRISCSFCQECRRALALLESS